MKHLLRSTLAALVLLGLLIQPASAQTVLDVYVNQQNIGQGFVSLATLDANISGVLSPAIADSTFLCNNSGASAVPVQCAIGSGLTFNSGTLSANAPGSPTARTLSYSTAYQATTSTKASLVTVNLSSVASLSLTTGTTNQAELYIGSTSGVASGTGTLIGSYENSLTGTLAIALGVTQTTKNTITVLLPAGWYFALLQPSGIVTISSAFDQSIG
jgi:hypothetical protein